MPHYPQQNFSAMRQDAIRRSREMQRRAAPAPPVPHPEQPSMEPASSLHSTPLPPELKTLLQGWDGERLALLGLLYFLWKEGADTKLLLAIAYIML